MTVSGGIAIPSGGARSPFNKLNCPLTNQTKQNKTPQLPLNGGCADGASHKANPGTSGRSFARAWLVLPRAARRSASSGGCRHGGFPIGSTSVGWGKERCVICQLRGRDGCGIDNIA